MSSTLVASARVSAGDHGNDACVQTGAARLAALLQTEQEALTVHTTAVAVRLPSAPITRWQGTTIKNGVPAVSQADGRDADGDPFAFQLTVGVKGRRRGYPAAQHCRWNGGRQGQRQVKPVSSPSVGIWPGCRGQDGLLDTVDRVRAPPRPARTWRSPCAPASL